MGKRKPTDDRFVDEDGKGLIVKHPDGRQSHVIGKKAKAKLPAKPDKRK